jgi:hypothetical protein
MKVKQNSFCTNQSILCLFHQFKIVVLTPKIAGHNLKNNSDLLE